MFGCAKCAACRWMLKFIAKPSGWVAICPNPDCPEVTVEP